MKVTGVEQISEAAIISEIVETTVDGLDDIEKLEDMDQNCKDKILNNFNIKFKDVKFSYDNNEVIKGVNFSVPEKTSLAIVGASGSGKSTLCSLLTKFYNIDSGEILIGNENIKCLTSESVLKNITVVFQNVYLFKDTIKNNIKFGKQNASDEEIINAAKKAKCHEFIMELENGYDIIIGEGGNTLSGGEKQRISIARAMLKNAPIVILDEATANIDPENEFYIQSAINELTKDKTLITIAHRLKTIKYADNIIVLDEGKSVQSGKHENLLNEDGIYKEFVEIRKQAESWKF